MQSKTRLSSGFLLAALGMIYGDIGVSPLYVLKYIVRESGGAPAVSEALILGSLSLILWSLLLLATLKGVLILLQADNQGEGGHFALYALVRERGHWLLIPAALGGAALLADSVLTPALSMSAALEGGRSIFAAATPDIGTKAIVFAAIFLLSALFLAQSLGSRKTGRFLGPVMLIWFLFIGVSGLLQLKGSALVLHAFDPRLGLRFLFSAKNPLGFALLGLVFLAVTGTEILYANLDFCGRRAIRRAWPFVLLCLVLNYLGQGAWLLRYAGDLSVTHAAIDPFFQMLPSAMRLPAVALALAAAWSASQTVINGSFTLVSEAIRLDLLPPVEIRYPSDSMMQEYIPSVNFLMWVLNCIAVAVFQSGQRMAAVYGLTIAIGMLTTTVLLYVYVRSRALKCLTLCFGVLETSFLLASLEKLRTGGVVTLLFTLLLLAAMLSWNRGEEIERRCSARLPLRDFVPQLETLRADEGYRKLADNLVYIDRGEETDTVDQAILYSLLDRGPKRAQAYWFVSMKTVGEPYRRTYRVERFGSDCVFRLYLQLGFKCSRPLTGYLREAMLDMEKQGIASVSRKDYCLSEDAALGTFHYVVLRRRATGEERFRTAEMWALRLRALMQELAGLREEWYTEEDTKVSVEWLPLSLDLDAPAERLQRRIKETEESEKEDLP